MSVQEPSSNSLQTQTATSKSALSESHRKFDPDSKNPDKKTSSKASSEHTPEHLPMSPNNQPLHIPPPDRRLGIYESKVNQPVSHLGDMNSVDFQLRKLVGLTIQSGPNNPKFSAEVLDEVTDLARQYMHSLIDSLHKYTEVQRHHLPGIADLEICFSSQNISPTDLYHEYQRTKSLDAKTKATANTITAQLNCILREYNAEHYNLDKEDPSLVFHANEQYEIAALVPRQNRPRDYIPEYFPELPPDFTYTSTGDYMKTISELKEIKVKLADESRLNEVSLYKLIDDDAARWNSAFEHSLEVSESSESENDEIMSISGEKDLSDGETPALEVETKKIGGEEEDMAHVQAIPDLQRSISPNSQSPPTSGAPNTSTSGIPNPPATQALPSESRNRFDFVAYAKKRKLAKERYAVEIQRRRNVRAKNIFMKAETFFSSFAKKVASHEDKKFFEHELENRFKRVIKATRKAESSKMTSLKSLLEKKRLAEKEMEQSNGVYEFGFNFDAKASLSDDSDDDMHEEAIGNKPIVFDEDKATENEMKFNFGDDTPDVADSASDAELADLEAELEAEGADLENALDPASHEGSVEATAPLKDDFHGDFDGGFGGNSGGDSGFSFANMDMQDNGSNAGEHGQPMDIENGIWGSDMDSDELEDLG